MYINFPVRNKKKTLKNNDYNDGTPNGKKSPSSGRKTTVKKNA